MEKASPHSSQERCFKNCDDLIRALGARRQFVGRMPSLRDVKTVGYPPGNAYLTEGGVVLTRMPLDPGVVDPYAAHEAVHHFHGKAGLDDEGTMMPLEFALYSLVKNREHRHELFDFFGSSYDSCDEVYTHVLQKGVRYFKSETWEVLLESAQPWVTKTGRVRATVLRRLGR